MAAPTLTGLDSPTFNENTVNATPQIIDSDVTFTDADNDYDGGTLTVGGLLAEDRISLANSAAIQFTGGNVYYDADGAGGAAAVLIGSASGGVGGDFVVTFNAAATAASIEALIENLTYANVSDNPTDVRDLTLAIVDAANNSLGDATRLQERTGSANPFDGLISNPEMYPNFPVFADLDGDGDLDVVLGEYPAIENNYGPTYFENVGTATSPDFVHVPVEEGPFSDFPDIAHLQMSFGDLDGDGDLDLAVGSIDTDIFYFENTGSATAASYVRRTGAADPFSGFAPLEDVQPFGRPTLVDIDGDGDLDLYTGGWYVGDPYVPITYFENTGTATAPAFVRNDAENLFDGLTADFDDYISVQFADMDDDGDLDAVLINRWVGNRYFENVGTATAPVIVERFGADNPFANVGGELRFGDLDNDGDIDAIVGGASGNVVYFENTQALIVTVTAQTDTFVGTAGNDTINGTAGGDLIQGLGGDDILRGRQGEDQLEGGVDNDTLNGQGGNDLLYGGDGADDLVGGGGRDTLQGGDGADDLAGGNGVDVLDGGGGDDTLAGGHGADTLTGGAGADRFVFTGEDLSPTGVWKDRILDLAFGDGDVIDLSGIDANAGLGGDQAFTWVNHFTNIAGQAVLRYSVNTELTTLQLDVDGDGEADFRIAITGDHSGTKTNLYTGGGGDTDGGWVL